VEIRLNKVCDSGEGQRIRILELEKEIEELKGKGGQ